MYTKRPGLGMDIPFLKLLNIGRVRSETTVQTKTRLLLKEPSDLGLQCLPIHQHILDTFYLIFKPKLSKFLDSYP